MIKTDLMYEGKAKKVWKTDSEDYVIVEYKDDATAFNGLKKGTIQGKGIVNNKVANRLFKYLEENGVATHFVEELSDRETLVKKVEIIPVEVVVRNIAAGGLSKNPCPYRSSDADPAEDRSSHGRHRWNPDSAPGKR